MDCKRDMSNLAQVGKGWRKLCEWLYVFVATVVVDCSKFFLFANMQCFRLQIEWILKFSLFLRKKNSRERE